MISKHIFAIIFLNESELISFCIQLNGFTYFYLKQIILFTINPLFEHCLTFSSISVYLNQFN